MKWLSIFKINVKGSGNYRESWFIAARNASDAKLKAVKAVAYYYGDTALKNITFKVTALKKEILI